MGLVFGKIFGFERAGNHIWLGGLACALVFLFSFSALGKSSREYKFDLFYQQYSGKTQKSFVESSPGFGFGAGAYWGQGMFSLVTKTKVGLGSGTNEFLDGSTASDLTYTYYYADALIGVKINLAPFYPVRPYFGANGIVGVGQLAFEKDATTTLDQSYTAMRTGSEIFVGVDFSFSKKGKRSMFIEMQMITASSNLAEVSGFDVGGLGISLGFGWK